MKKQKLNIKKLSLEKVTVLPLQQQDKAKGGCPPTSATGSCLTFVATCDNMTCTAPTRVNCPSVPPPCMHTRQPGCQMESVFIAC
ncbi:hypothetical protein [Taibaiella koreensis]|uniref:hypothetical protein n=1 Tax=Taibaiella koreensis TaxID=1268548 RepID=UPI000E59D461|nr:hypothetical protein [Taibaiella koreensis]